MRIFFDILLHLRITWYVISPKEYTLWQDTITVNKIFRVYFQKYFRLDWKYKVWKYKIFVKRLFSPKNKYFYANNFVLFISLFKEIIITNY